MPVAWHPTRWGDWCVSEAEKKGKKNFFNQWKVVQSYWYCFNKNKYAYKLSIFKWCCDLTDKISDWQHGTIKTWVQNQWGSADIMFHKKTERKNVPQWEDFFTIQKKVFAHRNKNEVN